MEKKKHHYVPKAYLNFFCDKNGKLRVYLKDAPEKIIHQAPDNTAFENYYYSQPLPEGGTDNNSLEDFFSTIESVWPPIVKRLLNREIVNDQLENIFTFIALQRVRVPASRDASEAMLAALVMATTRQLDAAGKLPPKPKGYEDILERAQVTIDPHKSIHAMAEMIRAMGAIFDRIGLGALHNKTDISFLTSDNPVIWFDSAVSENKMEPYQLNPDSPIVMLFPITPKLMIYGHSSMKQSFSKHGLAHGDLTKRNIAKFMNRQISRFAYRAIFAQTLGHESLIQKYAAKSPVLRSQVIHHEQGEFLWHQSVFGERTTKPKWRR